MTHPTIRQRTVSRLRLTAVIGFCCGCAPGSFPGGSSWQAKVTSIDDSAVCAHALNDGDERRGVECFSIANEYIDWGALDLVVGDCVKVKARHPLTVIESEIDCPNP